MEVNLQNFFNSYRVNNFLRKFGIHIAIVIGLTILLFFNRPLAGIGFIIWGLVTILLWLNW